VVAGAKRLASRSSREVQKRQNVKKETRWKQGHELRGDGKIGGKNKTPLREITPPIQSDPQVWEGSRGQTRSGSTNTSGARGGPSNISPIEPAKKGRK